MAIVQVPVTKSGGFVEFDTETIPEEVYKAALAEGLKSFVNKGMSKILTKGLEGEKLAEAKAAAQAQGEKNAKAIMDGTIKLPGKKAKADKVAGKVMTEARRLARDLVKDAIKREGKKVSHYKASEITRYANLILEGDQGKGLIAQAEENLKAREAPTITGLDLSGLVEDAGLVAKAEKDKAAKKSQLSAKQAGMVTKKSKPQQATAH